MAYVLRPYQDKAIRDITKAWKKHSRVLFQLPTGSGKTVVFARIISNAMRSKRRVLVVCHTKEIIEQTHRKLIDDGVNPNDIGIIKAGIEPNLDARCQIASVQSLRNRELPEADVVVIDEAHHASAYNEIKAI